MNNKCEFLNFIENLEEKKIKIDERILFLKEVKKLQKKVGVIKIITGPNDYLAFYSPDIKHKNLEVEYTKDYRGDLYISFFTIIDNVKIYLEYTRKEFFNISSITIPIARCTGIFDGRDAVYHFNIGVDRLLEIFNLTKENMLNNKQGIKNLYNLREKLQSDFKKMDIHELVAKGIDEFFEKRQKK